MANFVMKLHWNFIHMEFYWEQKTNQTQTYTNSRKLVH